MPEMQPSFNLETPATPERPISATELHTGDELYLHKSELIPAEEIKAKPVPEQKQPSIDVQTLTPQKTAGILTFYVMRLRRNEQNLPPAAAVEPQDRQSDFDLAR